jgi:predicted amidohydrolase YtcJ
MTPSLILYNARILTMDPRRARASAVAVAGDRILAVGEEELRALAGPGTRLIDAGGATLLPGFVESHLHLFSGAYGMTHMQLGGVQGLDALRGAVAEFAAANPDAALLFGQGADYALLGPDLALDRHVLDQVCPDRPLAVMAYDFHTLFANTAALKAAGLLQGRDLPPGNEVVMGPDGCATGELREKLALLPVLELRNTGGREMLGMSGIEPPVPPTEAERQEDRAALKLGLRHAAQHGITAMHNMDGNRYLLELLQDLQGAGALTARVKVPFHLTPEMDLSELERASAMTRDFCTDKLSSGLVKMFLDGVIESGTAAMLHPYANRPGHRGETLFTPEHFHAAAIEADRRGLQIAVHAIGDAAVRLALDGYAAAAAANGPRDSRHRIEHVEMIHPEDIPRFAALGVTASMQPPHAPVGESGTTAGIGPERARHAYAWRSIVGTGADFAFSSDWPIVPISPLAGIEAAMTREPWLPGLPDQRLSLHQVLEAYTIRGARVGHMDHITGRIAPGMKADLVLLSGDIEATPHDEIGAMGIRLTLCDGEITHEA